MLGNTHRSVDSIQSSRKAALAKAGSWELICIDDVRVAVVQGNRLASFRGFTATHNSTCKAQ